MSSFYDCLHKDLKYGYEKEYFWVSGVCLVVVGIFGFFGNLINFIILWRGKLRKNPFYQLLIALAFFDICFIVSWGIYEGYQAMACEPHNDNVNHVTYQILNIAFTGSIYMTIAISFERYLGICYPKINVKRGAWIYVLPVCIITVSFNFPRLLERKYFIVNGTLESKKTDLANSTSYKLHYNFVASTIIDTFIPLICLIFLNGSIISTISHTSKQLQNAAATDHVQQVPRKSMTNILFTVVIVFFICHLPRIVQKSLYYFGSDDDEFRKKWGFIPPIKKLTLMINSSINFVIYCLWGKTFRNEFYRFLRLSRYISSGSETE